MKQKLKQHKGITLIALIITIIVLLILAVVAISAVTGNGIIAHAKNAKAQYSGAQKSEQSMLSQYEYELEKSQGKVTGTYKDYVLNKEYTEKKNAGEFTGTYDEYVASKHALGEATNVENYGKKVVGYKSKGDGLDTLVWRIFYQDDKNVYLISETKEYVSFYDFDGQNYRKKSIVEKYNCGADVSSYGKALMPMANSLFTTSNTNETIIATAYLCDTTVWDAYTDAEGKASYAIGSPTIELFVKSYNASNFENTLKLSMGKNGYYCQSDPSSYDYLTTSEKNGIYINKFLASPGDDSISMVFAGDIDIAAYVRTEAVFNERRVCPIVSIPVSGFNCTLAD